MNKQEFLETYIADRHNTNCSKWDGLKEKFGEADLLPMWVSVNLSDHFQQHNKC